MSASPNYKSNNIFFDIIDVLCQRFMGLTPFEILNSPFDEVMEIYVDCILHDRNQKESGQEEGVEWVTSKNATWH